jgi:prepilin-type processing-associated H-X9-DG protein
LIFRGSEFSGSYINVTNISGGGVSDYGLNTTLHHTHNPTASLTTVGANRRRDYQLVNSPSLVLNYADTRHGVIRFDNSTFGAHFRHNAWTTINILFVDGRVGQVKDPGPGISFNRSSNNTIWYDNRPYYWW